MQIHASLFLSDWLLWGLFVLVLGYVAHVLRHPHLRAPWRKVAANRIGMMALVVFLVFTLICLLDSIHLTVTRTMPAGATTVTTSSVLDRLLPSTMTIAEKTYSAPFSRHLYTKSLLLDAAGKSYRGYALLDVAAQDISTDQQQHQDILWRIAKGASIGAVLSFLLYSLFVFVQSRRAQETMIDYNQLVWRGKTAAAWREAWLVLFAILLLGGAVLQLAQNYHVLGTTQVGMDVFYETLKSIRTGVVIGTLTTLFMLPFALVLGTSAGYFGGWCDDVIQYLYITLSSIPGVLLISASILVLQVYIHQHQDLFPTVASRADMRLLALCFILGITSWATLCRLLRAETMKLKHMDYVLAARTFGVRSLSIIMRHVLPNVMHIIMITIVLDFSGLVLAEAVLSYVGVGVDPTTLSWGNMINSARLEMAREPIVWWPLCSALIMMFTLVLSANCFADAVRDAFDPRV